MINGHTRLHVVANGTMIGQRYIDEVLLPHDCLDREGIQRLVWPARSPDLNPMENVWDALGRQVAGRNYPPTNKNTLICVLTEEWDKLPQQLLDNVVQRTGRLNLELAFSSNFALIAFNRKHRPHITTSHNHPTNAKFLLIYKIPNLHSHVLLLDLVGKNCHSGPKEPQEDISRNRDESPSQGHVITLSKEKCSYQQIKKRCKNLGNYISIIGIYNIFENEMRLEESKNENMTSKLHPKTVQTQATIKKVTSLILKRHTTAERFIAMKLGMTSGSVIKILHKDLKLKHTFEPKKFVCFFNSDY
ncbi:hypothetical protein TNCV_1779431 [Trichonephila clavipes]|nr:hypothetical protein TNCV_1779431 [Trichonephila clavipes]